MVERSNEYDQKNDDIENRSLLDNSKSGEIDETARALISSYQKSQYFLVQFIAEHLSDCGEAFGGDFAEMLVLAVLGQRKLETELLGYSVDEIEGERACMSASRIAEVSCIPRETVRRKLISLKARGWIERDKNDGWRVIGSEGVAPARTELSPLEMRSYQRLARLHLQLSAILAASGR